MLGSSSLCSGDCLLGLGGGCFGAGGLFLLGQVFLAHHGDAARGAVVEHLPHDLGNLLLQFADKLRRVELAVLYVAQLLLPDAGQLAALQQFLAYGVYQLYAGGGGKQVLALPHDVVALEERLNDAGSRRRTSYTVLLQGRAQFLVVYKFAGRLHGAQQGGLGVVFGRRGPFLGQRGLVRAALAFHEVGQYLLLVVFLLLIVGLPHFLGIEHAPSQTLYLLAGGLEFYLVYLAVHRGGGEEAVGVEGGYEAAGHQVVHVALHVGESGGGHAGGDDGVVVGHLRGVEHFLALLERGREQGHGGALVAFQSAQYAGAFGVDVVAQVLGVHTGIGGELALVEGLGDA